VNLFYLKILLFYLFFSCFSYSQSTNQDIDLLPLRESENGFVKKYRVLKTTISDKNFFKKKFENSTMNLDYVLRYHFYTGIEFGAKKNQLISMDGTVFNLTSTTATDITNEIIELIGGMFFGRKEYKNFKKQNLK